MSILDRLFGKGKPQDSTPEPVHFDESEMMGYLRYNSTAKYQGYRFDHFNKNSNPATLRTVLSSIMSSVLSRVSAMTCVSTSQKGAVLDVKHETDREKILDTKLFPLVYTIDQNGGYTPITGLNVTLILQLDGEESFKELVVFLRAMPGQITGYTWCMRVSLMVPLSGPDDDLLTGRRAIDTKTDRGSQYASPLTSFILYEDEKDIMPLTLEYNKVEMETMRKVNSKEQLDTMQEWAIVFGASEHNNVPSYISGARHYLSEGKWMDAYSHFMRAFHDLTAMLLRLPDQDRKIYYEVAYEIGVCLEKMKRYDEAAYFFWISQHLDRLGFDELVGVYARLCDIMVPEHLRVETYQDVWEDARMKFQFDSANPYDEKITLGYLFSEIYAAKPGNLTSLVILKAGETQVKTHITDVDQVWNYPMRSILDAGTTVIVGYAPNNYLDKTVEDKSVLRTESSFIMKVVPANEADGLMRVHIMLPNFPYDDYKVASSEQGNFPEGISIIMGKETMRFRGLDKDPGEILSVATSLIEEKRMLEALHAARYAHARVIAKLTSGDEMGMRMLYAALYQIGFCLMDFKLHEKANYYLRQAASSNCITYIIEYINSLSNLNYPHLLSIITQYEEVPAGDAEPAEYNFFMRFLKRRRIFYLIEHALFDEAEQLLSEMLNSPVEEDRAFAQDELAFIRYTRNLEAQR